jgi:hypothetical protein
MSKTVKIVIGVVIAIIVLAVVYYMFFATPSTPEAAAQKKVKSGNYGKWNNGNSPDWGAYIAKSVALFGEGNNIGVEGGANQSYASAWLKGMDIARSASNLEEFKTEIKAYVDNASTRKMDWEMTVGGLL